MIKYKRGFSSVNFGLRYSLSDNYICYHIFTCKYFELRFMHAILDGRYPSVFRCTSIPMETGSVATCVEASNSPDLNDKSLQTHQPARNTLLSSEDPSDDLPDSSYNSWTILNYFMPYVTNSYYSHFYKPLKWNIIAHRHNLSVFLTFFCRHSHNQQASLHTFQDKI